jgi:hypothetical protein
MIGLIGLHSVALGVVLLILPRFALGLLGFSDAIPIFFPSQSGIFLIILGACYLRALVDPTFVRIILFSKACAVGFLVAHAAFFGAPPIIWAAAGGDGAMLAVLGAALYRERAAEQAPKGR